MACDDNGFGSVCTEFGFETAPMGAIESTLIQQTTQLEELMAEAVEVQQRVRSYFRCEKDPSLIPRTMTNSTLDELVQCDELIDPGPKSEQRIREKVKAKYAGRYERNRDYARMTLIYDSVKGLLKNLKVLFHFSLKGNEKMQVVMLENRFAEPTHLGWRDLTALLKVQVPSSGRHHIMELQFCLKRLTEERKNYTHNFYKQIREVLPEAAITVVIDKLTNNATLGLDITKQEWLECLKNPQVNQLLDQLRIPNVIRRSAVDIVDADGSGMVSTAELREGLLLCSGDLAVSGGVVDCKLKVREIQQWLRNKMEPRLHSVEHMLIKLCMDVAGEAGVLQQPFVRQNCAKLGSIHSVASIGASTAQLLS
jgi:hypothetical protein